MGAVMQIRRSIMVTARDCMKVAVRTLAAALIGAAAFVPPAQAADDGSLRLTSSVFTANGSIPIRFTCDGDEVSPPLAWRGVPAGTESLALIVADPDAPDPKAPKVTWIHWVVYDIPVRVDGLKAGAGAAADAGVGARSGLNSWRRTGYGGMCPPVGRHRYFFHLYALDTVLMNMDRPSADELRAAMERHILGDATLMGTYAHGE